MTLFRDRRRIRRVAVVEHAVGIDVRKRVEMGVRDAVIAHRNPIRPDPEHGVLIRIRIVDGLQGVGVAGQRDGKTLLHQGGRLPALRRRDEIQRPDLIVLAPPSPVRKLLLPAIVFRLGHNAIRSGRWSWSLVRRERHP